jgi:hypothetical protein
MVNGFENDLSRRETGATGFVVKGISPNGVN